MKVNVLRHLRQIIIVVSSAFSFFGYVNYGVTGIILYLAMIELEEL